MGCTAWSGGARVAVERTAARDDDGKGWDYYLHNGMFHGKLTLFSAGGAGVAVPDDLLLSGKRKIADDAQLDATDLAALKKIKRCLLIEMHLYAIIPLLASLMARGYGAR